MAIILPTESSELGHIFREAEGHVPDTPANRDLLLSVANDPLASFGSDRYGNYWFGKTLRDGTQVWIQVRDGRIINGGINTVPRNYNPQGGLKRS